jgi:prepilin signal peptidase PulO-like enzyme (type II secretory pathway)
MTEKVLCPRIIVVTGLLGIIFYFVHLFTIGESAFQYPDIYVFLPVQMISVIVFIYILIYPYSVKLFGFTAVVSGLVIVFYGSQITGVVIYILGLCVLFISNRDRKIATLVYFGVVFLVIVLTQIRIGIIHMCITLMGALLVSLLFASLYLAYKGILVDKGVEHCDEIKTDYRDAVAIGEDQKEILDIERLHVSDKMAYCIASVEKGLLYKVIGFHLEMSESAVKNMMRRIFKLFHVTNREDLRVLLSRYTIQYPPMPPLLNGENTVEDDAESELNQELEDEQDQNKEEDEGFSVYSPLVE